MKEKRVCLDFSPEVKREAVEQAREIGVSGYVDVHHILPQWFARKYHLNPEVIKSIDNAIALEEQTFHGWIHGKRLSQYDEVVEWKGFDEADYIELATKLYGFPEQLFRSYRR